MSGGADDLRDLTRHASSLTEWDAILLQELSSRPDRDTIDLPNKHRVYYHSLRNGLPMCIILHKR